MKASFSRSERRMLLFSLGLVGLLSGVPIGLQVWRQRAAEPPQLAENLVWKRAAGTGGGLHSVVFDTESKRLVCRNSTTRKYEWLDPKTGATVLRTPKNNWPAELSPDGKYEVSVDWGKPLVYKQLPYTEIKYASQFPGGPITKYTRTKMYRECMLRGCALLILDPKSGHLLHKISFPSSRNGFYPQIPEILAVGTERIVLSQTVSYSYGHTQSWVNAYDLRSGRKVSSLLRRNRQAYLEIFHSNFATLPSGAFFLTIGQLPQIRGRISIWLMAMGTPGGTLRPQTVWWVGW